MDILNVTSKPYVDNLITSFELHIYQPSVSGPFEYNDEIRIPIQEVDPFTLPSESHLYIEGKLTKDDGTNAAKLKFIYDDVAFLFRKIRYELNGATVNTNRNVGLTFKAYLPYTDTESVRLRNTGWSPKVHVYVEGDWSLTIRWHCLMEAARWRLHVGGCVMVPAR